MRRSSGRRAGLASLGSVLKRSLNSSGLRHNIAERQAVDKWGEVVGPQIAGVTTVETVRDGVLFVPCKNSMWASELSLHTQEILKKLEAIVGRRVITDIRFSARGFRKALEQQAGGAETDETVDMDRIKLSKSEEAAAAAAASSTDADELAQRIRKAVLAGKRRERAIKDGPSAPA